MTGRKGRPGLRGIRGLTSLLAAAVVLSLIPGPAPAAGLFENIFGGLNRAFNGAPPPLPAPPPEPVSAEPDGYYPTNHSQPHWPDAARRESAIANAKRTPNSAPMGDPTLRPGDVVATADGLHVYTGGRQGLPEFVPVKSYPYFSAGERNKLLALQVTPPDRRWNAEAPLAPAATVSAWKPDRLDEFASLRTAQR
ncbi:MAG: hypothetical protein WCA36_10510 [Pseudolabrys sp.]